MFEQETSQLRRAIPPKIERILREREIAADDIIIATDTDLSIAGEYSERWIIVTRTHVLVFIIEQDTALLVREVAIENIESARTDSRVGSGFLEAKTDEGVYEELLRFSNRNADKFAKVAIKIKSLAGGRPVDVSDDEGEIAEVGRCQKCGIRLADRSMTLCPKCLKRGFVFMRFLGRTKGYWPLMAAAMTLVILTITLSVFPQQLVKVLIDDVFSKNPHVSSWFGLLITTFKLGSNHYHWLYLIVGLLALTTLTSQMISCLLQRIAVTIANRLAFELRRDVFEKLENQELDYHDTHPVGQLMTRCTQDVEALQGFVNQLTSGFGYQILSLIIVAAVMFSMDWKLALWACFPAPIVMSCTVVFYKWVVPRWHKYWSTRSNLSNILHASLSGVRVVKAFAQENREAGRFAGYSAKYRDAGLSVGYASAWFYPMMGFVFQLGSYLVWISGGHQILEVISPTTLNPVHELTVGGLMAFLGYLGMFYAPLNSLTQMSNWFTQFTTQAHRVFEILDREESIKEAPDAIALDVQGEIAFKNVTFGYDPHIPVLHEVSFAIKKGEMIGIVGHSGSGKSTTVSLIMRFYDPNEGQITVDNIDLTRIKKKVLRRQIGMVPQDPFLFRGTVAENICYGNPNVSPEIILDSSKAANAHMFITRNHDGYDTRLGERGAGLSGGERQRVAIARALLHNPRVLILDEATSSVDTIAEREIQKALEALSLGRTTIAIAHRLTTLRNCNRILVFEEGVIREQGSHEELMAKKGIYKKLVDIQTQLTSDQTTTVDNIQALDDLENAEDKKPKVPAQSTYKRNTQVPRIRYLDAKKLHIYSMDEGGMKLNYENEEYLHVRAYRCFPVSLPSEFVALWTGASALEHQEVGMVRHLAELSPSTRLAVEHELAKRYFIHYIQTINSIKEDVGFLHWDVESDKGHMEFMTKRWDRDTVVEGGVEGRIIFDVDNNRYEIENLDKLDVQSRTIFLKYIYW